MASFWERPGIGKAGCCPALPNFEFGQWIRQSLAPAIPFKKASDALWLAASGA